MADTYECAHCGGVFAKTRPDDEAMAAAREEWGEELVEQGVEVICDDCYREFAPWAHAQAEA